MLRRLTVVLCCCVLIGAASARAELHRLGFVSSNLDSVAPGHEAKSVPVAPGAQSFRDLPRVDLTGEMPPTGDQGQQGSCAAYAITYYHRTQLEYHERHWDLTDSHHQFSPAFTYNQVNGGGDNGSGFDNLMPLICDQGCASLADCPYHDGDCTSWPSESAYARALPFRTKDWAWFHTTDTTGLNSIKQLLVNGSTACLAIWVWGNFDGIAGHDYMYCVADKSGSNRGGHLVTFVGYDDTLTTHDGTGAFRMVNSWGPSWGQQGYFWMSYEAVMDPDLSQRSAGYMIDTVGYVPKLLARVRIEHPTRDRVGLEFTVGKRWSSFWLKDFRSWRHAQTDRPFPDHNIVFDLTDAASFITSGQTDSIYFCAWDSKAEGLTGTILSASVQYLDWGTIFASGSTPLPIPDNGDAVAAGNRIQRLDHDVTASWILGPSGIVEPESAYVPSVEVRNYGTSPAAFPVLLTIGADYADTVQVAGLAPARAETLAFAAWTVPARCTAAVRCSTALAGDEYATNDTCSTLTWARYRDIALTDIAVPGDTVDSGVFVRPQVHVRNNGTQADFVTATFRIPDEGYLRSSRVTVPAHDVQSITFATWTPKVKGSHAFRCTLDMTGDMDQSNDTMSGVVSVRAGSGVAEEQSVPPEFRLDVPHPSLFGRSVAIGYALPLAGEVSLSVYDATGAIVRKLVQGTRPAGVHAVTWNGSDDAGREVPAGAYFCRLEAAGRRTTAVLLKL
jgi:hypothetical protein